jgi:hypothetical protein
VSRPAFERYILFHPVSLSNFSTTPFQIRVALNFAPKGRPKYFIGSEEVLQPSITANPSMLETSPTGTNSSLAKFTFRPEVASNQVKTFCKCKILVYRLRLRIVDVTP